MSFSWSFLDLNVVLRSLGWLFGTKLSVLFFSNRSQKTLRMPVHGLFQVEETGQTWLHRQTRAYRVAGEERGRLNCESKAEGKGETQHGLPLPLEGDTLAGEAAPRGRGLGWGCQHGEDTVPMEPGVSPRGGLRG